MQTLIVVLVLNRSPSTDARVWVCSRTGSGVCEVCKQEAYELDPTILIDEDKDEPSPPPAVATIQIVHRPGGTARKRVFMFMILCASAERRRSS